MYMGYLKICVFFLFNLQTLLYKANFKTVCCAACNPYKGRYKDFVTCTL